MFNTIMEMIYKAESEGFVTWAWFEDTKTLSITIVDFSTLSDDEFDDMMMKDDSIVADILAYVRTQATSRTYDLIELYYFDTFIVQVEI